MWYCAKSWLTTWPNRGSSTLCSYSAIDIPWIIPPISWDRAVLGLITRPTSNIPSSRATRTSPVSSSTRTSANWAPKLCIAQRSASGWPPGSSAVASRPPGGAIPPCSVRSRARSRSAASQIAVPQLLTPAENPATDAAGSAVSPIRISTCPTGTPSASAAIWVSAVQVPVPRSAAAIRTVQWPSGPIRTVAAFPGKRGEGYAEAATPVPTSQRPSRRARGAGSRRPHPARRAPSRRQSARWRLENGSPDSGCASGSLRIRNSTGSRPQAIAISSTADSSAYIPCASPGARMIVGTGTSSGASRWVVRRCGAAYIIREQTATCSAYPLALAVCSITSWAIAISLPVRSAPSWIRWIDAGR